MGMLKIFAVCACAVGLCLALIGCGSSSTDDKAAPAEDEAAASQAADDTAAASQAAEDAIIDEVAPDPVSNDGDPSLIVGRWDVYSIDNGDEVITVDEADADVQAALQQQYIEIRDNGTMSMVDEGQGFSQDCTWTFDGKDVVLSFEGNPLYTLTLDGDTLSMGAEGMVMTYKRS